MKKVCSIIFLLVITLQSFSQHYNFKHFTDENGLPCNVVYSTFQDSKGYIWFATEMGISRFDGITFKNYTTNEGLPDNTVFQFYEDWIGRIWLRSFSGQLAYIINNKVVQYPMNYVIDLNKGKEGIMTSIYTDKQKNLFVSYSSKVVVKIDSQKRVTKFANNFFCLVKDSIYWFEFNNSDKTLWFANQNKKLLLFTNQDKSDNPVLIKLKNNNFLFANYNKLALFNKNIIYKTTFPSVISNLAEDKDGNIWISTYNDGIYYYKDGKISVNKPMTRGHAPLYNTKKYFNGKTVDFMQDREGNFWFATIDDGVYFLPTQEFKSYTATENLSDNKINCLETLGDSLVIGLNNGYIKVLYKGTIMNYNFNVKEAESIIALKTQANNNLWICYRKNNHNYCYTVCNNNRIVKNIEFSNNNFKSLEENKTNGNILIGTATEIYTYGVNDAQYTISPGIRIGCLYPDRNIIWLGNYHGLWRYLNNKLTNYSLQDKNLNTRIIEIKKDNNKYYWVATNGKGIVVFKDSVFYHITEDDGLLSNTCTSIYIDSVDNVVWVGTNKGLNKITKGLSNNYNIERYTTNNGLISNQIKQIIRIKDTLYIASDKGLTCFNTKNVHPNFIPPLTYITGVKVNYKNSDTIYIKNLSYNQNLIKIEYIGLSYRSAGNISYKYKLEGLNNNWAITKNNFVEFINLPPKNYKFIVYSQNEDGYWSSKPASIEFSIEPPFWNTWWFLLILIFIAIAVVWGIIYIRVSSVKKKTKIEKQLVEFEIKALRAQINPHFIFNALSSIQNFILKNDAENADRYLTKFAQLIRLILNSSKEPKIKLADEIKLLKLYLDLEKLRLNDKFDYTVNSNSVSNVESIEIPIMLIQPYVENAIWHGVSHKESKDGLIKIDFCLTENNYLICTIEDNGVGRQKAEELESVEKSKHYIVGMQNTKKRIELIRNSTVNIIDLFAPSGNPSGTRVEVKINLS